MLIIITNYNQCVKKYPFLIFYFFFFFFFLCKIKKSTKVTLVLLKMWIFISTVSHTHEIILFKMHGHVIMPQCGVPV